MSARYPTPEFRRTALAPAVLGVIALLVGLVLIRADGYLFIRFAVSILALIVVVFAWQARQWWWVPPLVAVAVLWNPVLPITLDGGLWLGLHYVAAMLFLLAGAFVKIRNPEDRNTRASR